MAKTPSPKNPISELSNSKNNSLSIENKVVGRVDKTTRANNLSDKSLIKSQGKIFKMQDLCLDTIPEQLAISIEQTEMLMYQQPNLDKLQYNRIVNRLKNIVNNLEEKVHSI